MMVVPEDSTFYDSFNVRHDAINADHMDMAKFALRADEGYKRILGHIKELQST